MLDRPTRQQSRPSSKPRRRSYKDCVADMNHRSTQFGVRENTASSRRHASRHAVDCHSKPVSVEEQIPQTLPSHFPRVLHAALQSAATAEERRSEISLLTVYEVAERLQVPVSWVYQRTRRHGPEQLPHFKIGKYLRFEEHALLDFIQRQRCA
jgi:predicted DNA-binding transcriptional regulator AlpA